MKFQFHKATKAQARLRLGLGGPPGSGKTFTALRVASAIGGKIAVVDTEHGSASKYAPTSGHPADGLSRFDFDTINIRDNYDPRMIGEVIAAAHEQGYGVLVIDSFTHFWNGPGGFLELVDAEAKRAAAASKSQYTQPDGHAAWKAVDPIYKRMVQSILGAPMHVIITMRAKMEHDRVQEGGRTKIVKLGIANEMRDNFPYELDVEGMMTMGNELIVGKTRCSALRGAVIPDPGAGLAKTLREWLDDGAAVAPEEPGPTAEQKARVKALLVELGVTSQPALYLESLEPLRAMPETASEFDTVIGSLEARARAKGAAKSNGRPLEATPTAD